MINKKHLKAVRRKRMLERRVKCHGNKQACGTHSKISRALSPTISMPKPQPVKSLEPFFAGQPAKKKGFFRRIFGA